MTDALAARFLPVLATGRAWGAVTIVNATATGVGCALAIDAVTSATWQSVDAHSAQVAGESVDSALTHAVERRLRDIPQWPRGLVGQAQTPWPASCGLKTSSSVAAALLRAGRARLRLPDDDAWVMRESVAASRAAGVTLTGALDDQAATVLGGAHLTDNRSGAIVAALPTRAWHVAVWVPASARISKSQVRALPAGDIANEIVGALDLAGAGDLAAAMTANGAAYTRLYRAYGLPVTDEPARVALAHGAQGAGLSGTGPAVAALFDSRVSLPDTPGGTWHWTRAVPA